MKRRSLQYQLLHVVRVEEAFNIIVATCPVHILSAERRGQARPDF